MNRHKTAMTVSLFAGLMHLIWEVVLFLGLGQNWLNWKLSMHSLSGPLKVMPFSLGSAIGLIVMSLVGGYIIGWVFASIYNRVHR